MGLQLTLEKEKNALYYDFIDAYWSIKEIKYTTSDLYGRLICYPTREASHKIGQSVTEYLSVGGSCLPIIEPKLYCWEFTAHISTIFPSGIPLSENEQKTAIYNWIKSYTRLPFEDVLEENTQETN